MTKIMRELYYMIDNWADQQFANHSEVKPLEARKEALEREIIRRIGEEGQEMLEALADLNLRLEDIHDKALFRAALRFGAEIRETG